MFNHKKHNGKKEHVESEFSPNFVTRISSIPLVHDSVTNLTSYVKSAPYGGYILDKSLDTLTTAQKFAQPYVDPVQQRLQPHINKADELAVKALNNLQEKFPIVNQPTSQIFDTVTKPPLQYYAEVKKTVESNVTEPATQTATAIAKTANLRATVIVDNVEAVVNHWLPGDHIKITSEGEFNQVMRLYDITASLPTRVTTLVNAKLDHHNIPHTKEDFIKLKNDYALLRDTTARIESLNVQLTHWVAVSKDLATQTIPTTINQKVVEARTTLVSGFDTTVTAVVANEKVQYYTAKLLAELEKTTEYVKQHSPTLPEYIQIRIDPLITFVNDHYHRVSEELAREGPLPSEKAKNVLTITQQQVLPLMKKSLDGVASQMRLYQQQYIAESERVLDGFKTSLKGLGVPVK